MALLHRVPIRADPTSPPGRIVGLDGIRGLAAEFVVLNHIFLRAWPGYPVDHAPFWAAEFISGRFAVIVFIALSGFSLGLAPARSGWRLASLATFAHRRAWRILPPYWAALRFSLVMTFAGVPVCRGGLAARVMVSTSSRGSAAHRRPDRAGVPDVGARGHLDDQSRQGGCPGPS